MPLQAARVSLRRTRVGKLSTNAFSPKRVPRHFNRGGPQPRNDLGQKEFHYRWEYDLNASPSALWPLVADTNRFNRDAGVPSLKGVAFADADGVAKRKTRRLGLSKFGVNVEWEEEPFEWVRPHRFGVLRRYKGGPVAEMRVVAQLTEREGGGTHLVYEVWAKPRGALGRAAIPLQIGRISARRFAETFRRYDELASQPGQDSEPLEASLKGFDNESFELWRVMSKG